MHHMALMQWLKVIRGRDRYRVIVNKLVHQYVVGKGNRYVVGTWLVCSWFVVSMWLVVVNMIVVGMWTV